MPEFILQAFDAEGDGHTEVARCNNLDEIWRLSKDYKQNGFRITVDTINQDQRNGTYQTQPTVF